MNVLERWSLLQHAFMPDRIAVIGASGTRGKWSNDVFRIFAQSFRGTLIPVNPHRSEVEGVGTAASVKEIGGRIDYAVIVVPRDLVPNAVRDCVAAGVPVVHVLSSGFAEVPGEGGALQAELERAVAGSGTVLIGPNSLGLYSARAGITLAWDSNLEPGAISFVSQSGGLCYDVLMRGQARGLGFSKILSVGNCADLDWPDYVRFLASDAETEVIALYIESVGDGRALFEALREASKAKTVVVLKGGRTSSGGRSAASHTGRLAGDYATWSAMIRQAGAIEVGSLDEMLLTLSALEAARFPSAGNAADLLVLGTGGGATVLIADACEDAGLHIAALDPETEAALAAMIPGAEELGGVGNPLEFGADRMLGDPGLVARLVSAAFADPAVGTALIHLNLTAVANNLKDGPEPWISACEALAAAASPGRLVCIVLRNGDGGERPAELERLALRVLHCIAGVAAFPRVEDALGFIGRVASQRTAGNQAPEGRYADALHPHDAEEADPATTSTRVLDGSEARALVTERGVAFPPWRIVESPGEALAAAGETGYPVAVKTAAPDILHKSDVGCVEIGIDGPDALRDAAARVAGNAERAGSARAGMLLIERMAERGVEMVIGLKRSDAFGATILVGMGGIWVEIARDYALRLCPVAADEARAMLRELKGWPLLAGARGRPPADVDALARLIVAVSELGASRADLLELDLNPVIVMAAGQGAVAVDARAIVSTGPEEHLT